MSVQHKDPWSNGYTVGWDTGKAAGVAETERKYAALVIAVNFMATSEKRYPALHKALRNLGALP